MVVYTALLIAALTPIVSKRTSQKMATLSFWLMVTVAAIRYGVGTDYWRYEQSFVTGLMWFPEHGVRVLVYLLRVFTARPQIFFVITSLLIHLMFRISFNKYAGSPLGAALCFFFYIALYYFNHSLNLVRQFIAMGIFLLNIDNILKRRFLRYNLSFVIMSLFHQSALVYYPLYFVVPHLGRITRPKLVRMLLLLFSLDRKSVV